MINNIKDVIINNIVNSIINKTFDSSVKIVKTSNKDNKFNHLKKDASYLLYIHIPFCDNLCPFCTFHKYKYDEKKAVKYFENLRKEIHILKNYDIKIDSIYIGGGSPLIHEEEIIKTLKLLKNIFKVEDISCETDPNHIKPTTINNLKGLVKRLSIGIQSFDNDILKELSRFDRFGDKDTLINKIKKIQGILPITNLDLIFNLPNQTKKSLKNDIKIAKELNVEQITTYPLMSSNLNSKFINRFELNKNKENFYNIICDMLEDYHMNNMWSFSKECEEKLNDEYVSTYNEYIGLGSGGFSYLDGNLFVNSYDLDNYENLLNIKKDSTIAKSTFTKKQMIQYYFLCTLFSGSFNIKKYERLFDINLEKYLKKEIFLLKKLDFIYIENEVIYLTKKGKYLLIVVMANFYSKMDKVRAIFKNKIIV
ncbi:coproporphyrinogen III oxidase [Malaciobacter molluscorum LMG 25693]|uniref:Coproporphyrinogen III oxidase n=1 Tax=Malaciobacter molluscorum LMG 25693 TaxID=870501 RepID=A0A2G1DLI2_9BACT|nr:coproporphyrinogen III oxidase family protein [Malaciobacter molluscorum]AXX92103.1 oxygen-independent coproporphyrinogen III oxidase [Malaciobacter molluscorum LMG 25693]PHO19331.1 coproporphyrinogen III oxidase [Malaciobacter molluscorum LMG 25693]